MPSTTDNAPKRPTPALLEERAQLEESRLAAGRESRRVEKAIAAIDQKIEAYVRHAEPKKLLVRFAGYLMRIGTRRASVRWKDELVDRCGHDVARELEESAGVTERLFVEPIPPS